MTHICNKCQQWRPLWRRAPLNDSEVFANVALTDIVITPLTGFMGTNNRTRVFWHRTQENCEEHRSNNSHFYLQDKTESLHAFFSAPSSVSAGRVTSSSSQRPEARAGDQKAQSEVCLLSAAHTVRHEKAQTPRQRGARVTQPPEGYFWAAEEETEENKYVISRRPGPRRRISWIMIESHRRGTYFRIEMKLCENSHHDYSDRHDQG